jgi:hypothetical protein
VKEIVMSTNNSRSTALLRDQAMAAGTKKNLESYASITVGTQKLTPAEIVSVYETRLARAKATAEALAIYRATLKDEREERAKTAKFAAAFKRIVEGMFFDSPKLLADFGLKPVRSTKRKVADKAAAVEKSNATREARHTMSKKQKKGIKGAPANSP